MAGFEVNITLDPDAFLAHITDWREATFMENALASRDAAEFIKEELERVLTEFPHPRGEPSPTMPFKGPPGMITGNLASSIEIKEQAVSGYWKVYPTAVYSRIQEFGGWAGTDHMTYIPPRPYFRDTVFSLDTMGPGGMEHIFYEHWNKARMRAVLF